MRVKKVAVVLLLLLLRVLPRVVVVFVLALGLVVELEVVDLLNEFELWFCESIGIVLNLFLQTVECFLRDFERRENVLVQLLIHRFFLIFLLLVLS